MFLGSSAVVGKPLQEREMLALYNDGPKRRRKNRWTPGTIAASVGAHAAVIGLLIGFAKTAEARPVTEEVIAEWKLDDRPKPPPPPPPPPPPEPPAPREPPKVELAPKIETPRERPATPPPPVKGNFVTPRPPETPPTTIPAPNPNAQPITQVDVSGIGKEGDVVGPVDPSDNRAPTGNTAPAPPAPPAPPAEAQHEEPASNEPMSESDVDVRPSLRNADDVQRALQRVYPSNLRDSGVTGETVLQFVIDEEGHVEPGTVEVVSSSDEAFASAARHITSTMRFSPAKAHGRNVRVTITVPVRWTLTQ
jgi:periplasmic protein TonB